MRPCAALTTSDECCARGAVGAEKTSAAEMMRAIKSGGPFPASRPACAAAWRDAKSCDCSKRRGYYHAGRGASTTLSPPRSPHGVVCRARFVAHTAQANSLDALSRGVLGFVPELQQEFSDEKKGRSRTR